MKTKIIFSLLLAICSATAYAIDYKKMSCKDKFFAKSGFAKAMIKIDPKLWHNSNCQVVATKSIFPTPVYLRLGDADKKDFAKGLQTFVYLKNKLKWICIPGDKNFWAHCSQWKGIPVGPVKKSINKTG